MNSMTGYGKGIAEGYERKITVETKAVNHRFLDLLIKLPRGMQFADDIIRKAISQVCVRGHIDVYVNYEDNRINKNEVTADLTLAKAYLESAKKLQSLGFSNNFGVADVMKMPEVVTQVASQDDETIIADLIQKATVMAVENLTQMRKTEGDNLICDMKNKVAEIADSLERIVLRAPLVADEYRIKLTQRVQEALAATEIDQNKIASEVAFFIDKSNIDEEITRLRGHIMHYQEIFAEGGAVGKKLDFLTQEANREVNTIGSKSNDIQITKEVLYLKNLVEMVREQVQNLE